VPAAAPPLVARAPRRRHQTRHGYSAASGGGRGAIATSYTRMLVACPVRCGGVREGGLGDSSLKEKCVLLIEASSEARPEPGGVPL